MDRNELREKVTEVIIRCPIRSVYGVTNAVESEAEVMADAAIRTVIDEVAGMLLGYAKQEHDAHDLDGYQAFRNAALLVRFLLPSTDSEAR